MSYFTDEVNAATAATEVKKAVSDSRTIVKPSERPRLYNDTKARLLAKTDLEHAMQNFKGVIQIIPTAFDHSNSRKAAISQSY